MLYRLSIDAGMTSLGWCLLGLNKKYEPVGLIDAGVRIYSDGRNDKTKEPLAVSRRNARTIRRNLDRRDKRQKRLMLCLIEGGLMPSNADDRRKLEALDPYMLRAKALDEKIPLHHLGRVLFHINQRRGFKSNRKTDKRENDMGAMKRAIEDLKAKLDQKECRTLGEYLYQRLQEGDYARVRTRIEKGKAEYDFYPGREMYEHEIDAILKKQQDFHVEVTDDLCNAVKKEIFHQRPLKKPDIGKCRFDHTQERARLALPEVQKFRILQEVNNLDLVQFKEGDPALMSEDRQKIIAALLMSERKTFGQIRKLLDLPSGCKFNLESERRKELKGDETGAILSGEDYLGEKWQAFTPDEQNTLIALLFDESDTDELVLKLLNEWDLDRERAEKVADAPLQDGYGRVSLKAIRKIIPYLQEGAKYPEACEKAGYHHSDDRTGEVFDLLPYYGEILPDAVIGGSFDEVDKNNPEKYFGKINNPTVHIMLNQIRKLVNAVIENYGQPEDIVIEMARELKEPRDNLIKEQTRNYKENERINRELEKLGGGIKQNYRNRMLYKLWEDLASDPKARCCPFCTDPNPITPTQIFHTAECEEEHILPFSRSYNDGRANKVIAHRACNRRKAGRDPFDAFGSVSSWNEILARVENLPKNKQWRFQPDCWDIARGEGEDVLARMLNDTRYMARMAKKYLSAVYNNEKGRNRVRAIPGQMTALLRDKWGLGDLMDDIWRSRLDELFPDKPQLVDMLVEEDDSRKNRMHHMHHAVDAFVAGCTTQGMLQRLSSAARDVETKPELQEKRKKLVTDMPEPFEGFRNELQKKLESMIIAHKPDHGGAYAAIGAKRPYTVAPLHKQTAYGYVGLSAKKDTQIYVTRAPLDSLSSMKDIEKVADSFVRNRLKQELANVKEGSVEWKQILEECGKPNVILKPGIRRVRMNIEKTDGTMIGIVQPHEKQSGGKPYKFYELRGNYCAEIWCADKGKKAGQWQCEIIPNYFAHQKDFSPQWQQENPTAKLIMRLQINDMVAYEENGRQVIARVKKMTGKTVYFRDHRIAREEADKLSRQLSAAKMQEFNLRKISVDILGRVKDPGKAKAA